MAQGDGRLVHTQERRKTAKNGHEAAHSFQTLMAQLQTIVRNTCRTQDDALDAPTFEVTTTPNHTHKRALDLIK